MERKKLLASIFIVSSLFVLFNYDLNVGQINVDAKNSEVSPEFFDGPIFTQNYNMISFDNFNIEFRVKRQNFTLETFKFATSSYANNFSISRSGLIFDNFKANATLIEYNDVKIFNFDFKFLESEFWNVNLDFLGDINVLQIASAQLLKEEETTIRIVERKLLNMVNIKSQFYILDYFSISSIMKIAFIVFPGDYKEDYDILGNSKGVLDAFEIPLGGTFLEVKDGNGKRIFSPNIYDITSHAASAFNRYLLNGNKIFYTIGEIYIFLYWLLQSEYYNQYQGAIPDLSYWQRISGEIFNPETTVHIRNLGNSIRHFLFCRKYMRDENSFYVNQSISWALDYLQGDSVFQTFKNGKFWSHDIHLGELNKEWILNAHTGSLLTLIIAKNEGFNISQVLLDDGMNLLFDNFWDFDMGFNRIAYAILKNGVYHSFTSKSDNYELLILLDFMMMFKFLPSEQKEIVSQYMKYMYTRYAKLDELYVQTLSNHGILFDLSIFFEENHFISYFKRSFWIERTMQDDNSVIHYDDYSVFRVFGTEDYFVMSNIGKVTYNELNISLHNIKTINFYNLTSQQSLIFISGTFDQLLGMNITKDICLILYFDDGITHEESINKFSLVYLIVLGQIVILASIIGFIFYKKKINPDNKIVQYGKELYQKVKERKLVVSIFSLAFFILLIALPIFLNLEQYTYSLGTVFSIYIRRSILYLNMIKLVLIFSLSSFVLYLLIQLLENILVNKKILGKLFESGTYKNIINIYRLILIPLFIFIMNLIWSLAINQSISQSNSAYIILYIIQLIAINLVLLTSKIIPYKEDIFSFRGGKIVSKIIYIGSLLLISFIIILQFYSAIKSAVTNLAVSQIVYFIVLLLISIFILLTLVDYLLKRKPVKLDLSLFNMISLLIVIYPAFYVDILTITDISIASFYSNLGIWLKLLFLLFFLGFMFRIPVKASKNKKSKIDTVRKYAYYTYIVLVIIAITIFFTLFPYIYNISNVLLLFLYFIVFYFVVVSSKNLVYANFIDVSR